MPFHVLSAEIFARKFLGKRFLFVLLAGVILAGLAGPVPVLAQTAEDCLDCHDDEEFTKNEGTRVISLHVDTSTAGKTLSASTATPTWRISTAITMKSSRMSTAPCATTTSRRSTTPASTGSR